MFTSKEDLRYVAGLYEGEGSCQSYQYPYKNSRKFYTMYVVKIGMTDIYPLEEVKRITGLGNITGPYVRSGKKPCYHYQMGGFENVQAFLVMIFPWLSPRRKHQVCNCLGREYIDYYDYEDLLD
jgi:hypothetical protein